MFLPPYSLDFNPIEELFSYIKCVLKEHDEFIQSLPDFEPVLNFAFGLDM